MECLGDELIFNILKKLSADEVSDLIFVCKKWYRVIAQPYFMKTNLIQQKLYDNMLIQTYDEEEDMYSTSIVSVRNGRLWRRKAIHLLSDWKIQGSCNSLLLIQHMYDQETLAIFNPLTNCTLLLPPCQPIMEISSFAFMYVPSSETYYVIHMSDTSHPKSPQSLECKAVTLTYDLSEEEIQGLEWNLLWGGDFLGHTVRCSTNPICLEDGIVVWKLSIRKHFLAWDVGAGTVSLCPLPGPIDDEPEDGDDFTDYFLMNKGGSLAFVDYNEGYTVVRIRTLEWNTKEWKGVWYMGLHGYRNLVGFEVDEITPYFIEKTDKMMILAIDRHVFEFVLDIVTRSEIGSLSGKTITFCCNHVESIVSLKKALTFGE